MVFFLSSMWILEGLGFCQGRSRVGLTLSLGPYSLLLLGVTAGCQVFSQNVKKTFPLWLGRESNIPVWLSPVSAQTLLSLFCFQCPRNCYLYDLSGLALHLYSPSLSHRLVESLTPPEPTYLHSYLFSDSQHTFRQLQLPCSLISASSVQQYCLALHRLQGITRDTS